ncbi:hypothetical protein [Mycobacterium szulgai]|uniref:hypothetical protein n=1 Tax=Mycobacterium szulgai TaxID=1787 RepID=UPI0021F3863D|nr:hypothetical protein [Mycobacterium szulgai]MCV7075685.1 hypothetical protein [Mycobacterium szulgai]
MASVAGGAGEGASAAARAGTYIAHQLYTSGVSAMAEAGAVAKEAGSELGSGEFGQALKRAWRPSEHLRESFESIQQFHQDVAQALGEAVDTSYDHYRPRFAAALTGEAGDALLASHDATVQTWSNHQDKHTAAATAAAQALGHIKGLQGRIDNLAEAGEEEFNEAVRNRDPVAAMDVWTRYNGLAETSTSEATGKATSAIHAANFTIPLDVPRTPETKDGAKDGKDGKEPEAKRTPKNGEASRTPEDGADPASVGNPADGTPPEASRTPKDPTALRVPSHRQQALVACRGCHPDLSTGHRGHAPDARPVAAGDERCRWWWPEWRERWRRFERVGAGFGFQATVGYGVVDADFPRVVDALGTFYAGFIGCGVSDVECGIEFSVGVGVGHECYRGWECPVELGFSGVSAVGDAAGAAHSAGRGCSGVREWPGRRPAVGARGRCWPWEFIGIVERWRYADDAAARDGRCGAVGSLQCTGSRCG